jgi:hypothetical protein
VPILALTFHSARYDHLTLRRLVAQVDDAVKQVPLVAETTIIGGAQRQVRVLLDPAKLASRNLSPGGLIPMLRQANKQFAAGGLTSENQEVVIETGAFLQSAKDVGNVVVGVYGGKPVYLREVAEITDGAEEPVHYVLFGNGVAAGILPAVEPGFQPGGKNAPNHSSASSSSNDSPRAEQSPGVADLYGRQDARRYVHRRTRRHAQPSPSDPARMPFPSRTRCCAKWIRSRAARFRRTSPSRSRGTTAKPPPRNPTNCSATWASR